MGFLQNSHLLNITVTKGECKDAVWNQNNELKDLCTAEGKRRVERLLSVVSSV